MAGWRFRWAAGRVFNRETFRRQTQTLSNPLSYYSALLLKLVPGLYRPPITFRLLDGLELSVREFMTIYIYEEIFVDKIYDVTGLCGPCPVVVDVGANTGLFALRIKQLYPDAAIFCFEPHPDNVKELGTTIARNRLGNVTVSERGVAGTTRSAWLHIHPRNVGGHSILNGSEPGRRIEINVIDIDSLLNALPGGTCELLKLDCEGAEREIIESLTPAHALRIKRVIYEPSTKLYDPASLNARLGALGYDVKFRGGLFLGTRRTDEHGDRSMGPLPSPARGEAATASAALPDRRIASPGTGSI